MCLPFGSVHDNPIGIVFQGEAFAGTETGVVNLFSRVSQGCPLSGTTGGYYLDYLYLELV